MKVNEYTLCIDPGVNAMGFALFPGVVLNPETPDDRPPSAAGVIEAEQKFQGVTVGPVARILGMNRALKVRLGDKWGRIRAIICEYPEIMRHGRGLAAANSGSVLQLATAVGTYAQMSIEMTAAFLPIAVSSWKGNLPKEVVCARLQKTYGVAALKPILSHDYSHDWDAAGIGAFTRGRF